VVTDLDLNGNIVCYFAATGVFPVSENEFHGLGLDFERKVVLFSEMFINDTALGATIDKGICEGILGSVPNPNA
jgi:hypothetical protein